MRDSASKFWSWRCICVWFWLRLLGIETGLRAWSGSTHARKDTNGQDCGRHVAIATLLASRVVIQHDKWHPQENKFWKKLAHGLQETNGKRGGLGGECGRGRRPFPSFNKKKPLPLSPWAFFPQGPFFCKHFNQHHRKVHVQLKH